MHPVSARPIRRYTEGVGEVATGTLSSWEVTTYVPRLGEKNLLTNRNSLKPSFHIEQRGLKQQN